MKVVLLGTGGPRPDPHRMGPCTLFSLGQDHLLFDAGRGAAIRVVQAGVAITRVGYVFITHLHFDHIGGLADLLFAAWNNARNQVIKIFGPRGTQKLVHHLFEAYSSDIWYRLKESAFTVEKLMDIREMVEVIEVEPGLVHGTRDWRVFGEYVDHGHGLGMTVDEWPCLGYRVEAFDKKVAISGDAVMSPGLLKLAQDAHALILCCYLTGAEITGPDLELISTHVLTSSGMAGKIAAAAKAKKLVLHHIRQKPGDFLARMVDEIRKDFNGPIIVGEDLMEIQL
jgi:ribonuclease Z